MDFKATAYNTLFKRNSLWIGCIIATAVVIEGTSSSFMDSLWHNLNKGVSRSRSNHSLFLLLFIITLRTEIVDRC